MAWGGPKWGREVIFPANPDLADILRRTDFDFENLYFFDESSSQATLFPGSGAFDRKLLSNGGTKQLAGSCQLSSRTNAKMQIENITNSPTSGE